MCQPFKDVRWKAHRCVPKASKISSMANIWNESGTPARQLPMRVKGTQSGETWEGGGRPCQHGTLVVAPIHYKQPILADTWFWDQTSLLRIPPGLKSCNVWCCPVGTFLYYCFVPLVPWHLKKTKPWVPVSQNQNFSPQLGQFLLTIEKNGTHESGLCLLCCFLRVPVQYFFSIFCRLHQQSVLLCALMLCTPCIARNYGIPIQSPLSAPSLLSNVLICRSTILSTWVTAILTQHEWGCLIRHRKFSLIRNKNLTSHCGLFKKHTYVMPSRLTFSPFHPSQEPHQQSSTLISSSHCLSPHLNFLPNRTRSECVGGNRS